MEPFSALLGVAAGACLSVVSDVGKSLGEGLVGDKAKGFARTLKHRLAAQLPLPKNHDLVRQIRTAELVSLARVVDAYEAWLGRLPACDVEKMDRQFAGAVRVFLEARLKLHTDGGIDFSTLTQERITHVLDQMIDVTVVEGGADSAKEARSKVEQAFLVEVEGNVDLQAPMTFRDFFLGNRFGRGITSPAWYDMVALYIAEKLKTDERFRSIFVAAELIDIKKLITSLEANIGRALQTGVLSIKIDVEASHREIMSGIGQLQRSVDALPASLVAQIGDRHQLVAELEQVRAKYLATESLIANFLLLMVGQAVPPDQFAATLYANMERWRAAGDRLGTLGRLPNLTPVLADLRERAQVARSEERIEDLWLLVEEIDRIEQQDYDRADQRLREVESERQTRREALLLTKAMKRDTALAAFRVADAARAIAEIVDLEIPEHVSRATALHRHFVEWYESGQHKGLNINLRVSVEIARLMVLRADGHDMRGSAQNNLGNALSTLGARESGTERLEESVAAYHAALQERTRERAPLDWAMTQNNLGDALRAIGERESGIERLEEAVAAFRAALEEWTRERVPLDWALAQNNLGNVFSTLGERESSTQWLEQSVGAYYAALQEWTRERVPLQWAMTQSNLGAALWALGERESSTERLEEAVVAHYAALQELTRERAPFDWAMAQNNLGTALWALGERESGTEWLKEAVATFHAALQELTRERGPLQWAMTQNNLGNALRTLGERESNTEGLEEAVAAYNTALQEWTRERVPLDWAMAQNNLGTALLAIGERETGTERLEVAVAAFQAALQEWTRERVPLNWAMAQNNLGNALLALGQRESGSKRLVEAVAAYRAALQEWTLEAAPRWHGIAVANLWRASALLEGRDQSDWPAAGFTDTEFRCHDGTGGIGWYADVSAESSSWRP